MHVYARSVLALQFLESGLGVRIHRESRRADMRLGAARRETLDLTDRHATASDFTGDAQACLRVGHCQEGACVADGNAAFLEQFLDRFLELEQADGVGDGGAVFPGTLGHLFLREMEFVDEALEGVRLLNRIEILALEVFHQRHLQRHFFRNVTHYDWNAKESRALGCTPATL